MKTCTAILSISIPLILAAGTSFALQGKEKQAASAGAQGDVIAHEMPKPGKEHKWLMGRVGTWDCVVHCSMMPEPAKGVEINEAFGDFWIVSKFESSFMGQPMKGLSLMGYDPLKQKYVSTWCDNMSPSLFVMEGTMDASGKILTSTGKGPNMEGKVVDFTNVCEIKGDDACTFVMYETAKGPSAPDAMKIEYKRRK